MLQIEGHIFHSHIRNKPFGVMHNWSLGFFSLRWQFSVEWVIGKYPFNLYTALHSLGWENLHQLSVCVHILPTWSDGSMSGREEEKGGWTEQAGFSRMNLERKQIATDSIHGVYCTHWSIVWPCVSSLGLSFSLWLCSVNMNYLSGMVQEVESSQPWRSSMCLWMNSFRPRILWGYLCTLH